MSAASALNKNAKAIGPTDLFTVALTLDFWLNPEPDYQLILLKLTPQLFPPPLPVDPDQAAAVKYALRQVNDQIHFLERNCQQLLRHYLSSTVPYPGEPSNWQRRLLPAGQYQPFHSRLLELQEARIAAVLKLAAVVQRLQQLTAPPEPTQYQSENMRGALRAATAIEYKFTPPPTPTEFIKSQTGSHGSPAARRLTKFLPRVLRQTLLNRTVKKAQRQYDQALTAVKEHQDSQDYADQQLRRHFPPLGFQNPNHYQLWMLWNHLPGIYQLNRRRQSRKISRR